MAGAARPALLDGAIDVGLAARTLTVEGLVAADGRARKSGSEIARRPQGESGEVRTVVEGTGLRLAMQLEGGLFAAPVDALGKGFSLTQKAL
jgi:hypothetical protein